MMMEKTPLDLATEADGLSAQLRKALLQADIVLGSLFLAWLLIVVFNVFDWNLDSPWITKLAFVGFFLLFNAMVLRQRRLMKDLRLRVNGLFVHHRKGGPATCGSMDPHLTRARSTDE